MNLQSLNNFNLAHFSIQMKRIPIITSYYTHLTLSLITNNDQEGKEREESNKSMLSKLGGRAQ